jgi:hypothetical protein
MEKIEKKFIEQISNHSDINEHIQTLYKYSKECEHITEMGVRWVSSTWAFLYSKPKKLVSYDIVTHENINEVINLSKEYGIDFEFIENDVLNASISPTELLFIDTLHTYNQLTMELNKHSIYVSKYIILHDTSTYGFTDEPIYNHSSKLIKNELVVKQGIMNAVNDFLDTDLGKQWVIFETFANNNGLTILKRK